MQMQQDQSAVAFYKLSGVKLPENFDPVAWWGAILATIVFLWDIFKWATSGAKVRITVSPNMQIMNAIIRDKGPTIVMIKVTNNGDQATTITHLAGEHYSTLYNFLVRRDPATSFVVVDPGAGSKIPHVLQPGTEWMGTMLQDELMKFSKGVLRVGIFHSASKSALYKTVKFPPVKVAKPADVPRETKPPITAKTFQS